MNVKERFLNYVKIDTQSLEDAGVIPSTKKQFELGNKLVEELKELGLDDVSIDENCYVMAKLPANIDRDIPRIGFIAHMDTSPDMSGKDVNPRIVENYDGQDIILNDEKGIVMKVSDFPELSHYKGQDLIVTDGLTLLGADDKAGIAEIISAVEYLINNPDIPHGDIMIGFTPDEEVGCGADKFDVEKFDAKFAYTVDGGEVGEIEYENFNAASANIKINGVNIHPGSAKGKMKNALLIAMELNNMLPEFAKPENTEKYEGFYHLTDLSGEVESASMHYIIRDHDMDKFLEKKDFLIETANFINKKYGENTVVLEIKDSYYNMKEKILPVMEIVDVAIKAIEKEGIEPIVTPIRGGTDGARLSYMGLPTPNIFTGGHNFHGKFEYIPVQSMEKSVKVILNIIESFAKK
ncbi:MAG: peptidase T [Firmicutes bacterium]|jgi:tripeptide aminopeptidase|nr:peptidase T [Bacillota bacterium]